MLSDDTLGARSIMSGAPSITHGGLTASTPSLADAPPSAAGLALQPISAPQAGSAAATPAGAVLHVGAGQAYATIQAAVDAAHDGDTIVVNSGVYHEQVTMDGLSDVTIEAAAGAAVIIEAPTTLVENGDGVTAIVAVENGSNNFLRNITISGDGAGDGAAGAYVGVYYQDASGGTENVNVFGVRNGGPDGTITSAQGTGYGVRVNNDALGERLSFTMTGGSISDFQKGGVFIDHADVDISGLSVIGAGATDVTAQNGIYLHDATGDVHNNSVSELGFIINTFTAVGILARDPVALNVTDNDISGAVYPEHDIRNFVGIELENTRAVTGTISGNTISNVNEGIVAYGRSGPFTITDNDVSSITDYDPGVAGYGVDFSAATFVTASLAIAGTAGNDHIVTAQGDDTLSGGSGGDDTLTGGLGADTYYVDSSTVLVREKDVAGGHDAVIASVSYSLTANVEDLSLTGTATDGKGNSLANLIEGNEGDNNLSGGVGADTLDGGAGKDRLVGGQGDDTLVSRGDGDTLAGNTGADTFKFTDLTATNAAQIVGFEAGETIDLSDLSATLTQVSAFDGSAGEFKVTYDAVNNRTVVAFDLDGDQHTDHKIVLNGGDFSHAGDITFVL